MDNPFFGLFFKMDNNVASLLKLLAEMRYSHLYVPPRVNSVTNVLIPSSTLPLVFHSYSH